MTRPSVSHATPLPAPGTEPKANHSVSAADESNVSPIVRGSGDGNAGFDGVQLTDETLAKLTDAQLTDVSLFYFDDGSEVDGGAPRCKVHPGDDSYPDETAWKVLDLLSGGALIKTVPLGSACYEGPHYDEGKCQFLNDHWNASETQYAFSLSPFPARPASC